MSEPKFITIEILDSGYLVREYPVVPHETTQPTYQFAASYDNPVLMNLLFFIADRPPTPPDPVDDIYDSEAHPRGMATRSEFKPNPRFGEA